jgi:ATP-dependent Clp protease protease subunit
MGAGYSMKARAEEAEVYIYEDIGEGWFGGVTAKQFAADLRALGDVKVINLHVNSYGGEVFDAVAIYRTLVEHPARVVTHIDGVAASSAATVSMAGDEIRISESGMLMIHNAWGVAIGEAKEMRQTADLLETLSGTIGDVYAQRSGQSKDQISAWMDATTWMTAAEAVERGFANSVMENLRVAASARGHRETYADHPRPKARQASQVLRLAAETLPDLCGRFAPTQSAALAPITATRPAHAKLTARLQTQAAMLATHRADQTAAG